MKVGWAKADSDPGKELGLDACSYVFDGFGVSHPCRIRGTHTHTHPFNGPLSGTTRVIQYQKGKANLDFIEARMAVASAGPYASLHLAPER